MIQNIIPQASHEMRSLKYFYSQDYEILKIKKNISENAAIEN